MSGYYNNYDTPSLTFISTPDFLQTNLERTFLRNPYLLLKFRPKCACGKEFRSSGKDKAEAQIKKHLGYKKYANCKPVVEELDYNLPEFVTLQQVKGSDANKKRNERLEDILDDVHRFETFRIEESKSFRLYGLHVTEDDQIFNTKTGEYLVEPNAPKVIDGYQIDKYINIKATIAKKSKPRGVTSNKTGKDFVLCEVLLEDENGDTIRLTLWNDQCDQVSVGDKITIRNAYVKDGQSWHQGFGYTYHKELALYKNASTITIDQKAQTQEVVAS